MEAIRPHRGSSVFRDPFVVFAGCFGRGDCSTPSLECLRSVTCAERTSTPQQGHPHHEAYVSAEQPPPQAQTRVPWPHAHPRRPCHSPASPCKGTLKALSLTATTSFVPLRGSRRFSSIYRRGTKVRRGPIVVFSLPSRSPEPEVGFVAGRSVGNAPTRNRAKRRLREAARQAPLVGNRAYVMVATADVADVPFVDLVASVTEAATAIEEEAS